VANSDWKNNSMIVLKFVFILATTLFKDTIYASMVYGAFLFKLFSLLATIRSLL